MTLITFEGTEGAGKSTLIAALTVLLREAGIDTVATREPGGSSVAEKIRALILNEPMDPWTEAFLYEAARAEHLQKTILPALKRGAVVLCDRFTDSTLAYQGAGRGLSRDTVAAVNQVATGGLKPDLTLVLDLPPAVGQARQRAAGKSRDRFEQEDDGFHYRVAAAYLAVSGPSVRHLDAGLSRGEVLSRAWAALAEARPGTFGGSAS